MYLNVHQVRESDNRAIKSPSLKEPLQPKTRFSCSLVLGQGTGLWIVGLHCLHNHTITSTQTPRMKDGVACSQRRLYSFLILYHQQLHTVKCNKQLLMHTLKRHGAT